MSVDLVTGLRSVGSHWSWVTKYDPLSSLISLTRISYFQHNYHNGISYFTGCADGSYWSSRPIKQNTLNLTHNYHWDWKRQHQSNADSAADCNTHKTQCLGPNQWRHSLWTRVDKVQGPQGSKGPRAMQQKSTSMYHKIQVMFHSIKAHVIYPIMDTAIFQFQSRFGLGGHLETVHISILKMSAKPIR